MSQKRLESLLQTAVTIVGTDIRNALNKKVTVATFTPWIISNALVRQLQFTYADKTKKYPAWAALSKQGKEDTKQFIYEKSQTAALKLYNEYKKLERLNTSGIDILVSGDQKKFTVTTSINPKNPPTGFLDPFSTIKIGYSEILKELWVEVGQKLQLSQNEIDSDTFNLEHKFGEAVANRRVSAGINFLQNAIKKVDTNADVKAVFEELGLSVWLGYGADFDLTKVEVYVGPAATNKRQATKEKQLIADVKKDLQKALKTVMKKEKINNFSGSDSRVDIEKKKVISAFIKTLKKDKRIKATSINTRLQLSNRTTSKKIIKGKSKISTLDTSKALSKTAKEKIITIKQTAKPEKPVLNLNALKAQINARLSMTVIKNMGTPALENRTGRFARSAIVTDVTQTSKGFPSIGYTYQKYPYQTFEPGFKQGSVQRDPRTLIDRSIREIASELLVGRFYTRRT